jgi:hypothetical protein
MIQRHSEKRKRPGLTNIAGMRSCAIVIRARFDVQGDAVTGDVVTNPKSRAAEALRL